LDPWSYAGVGYQGIRNNPVPTKLNFNVIWMDGASHHLDLWWPHPDDPPSVIKARKTTYELISEFLEE
jgi:hypothetical protein